MYYVKNKCIPEINMEQRKTCENTFWIETNNVNKFIDIIKNKYNNVLILNSFFFRNLKELKNYNIIIITGKTNKPYNFLKKIDSCIHDYVRYIPSSKGSVILENNIELYFVQNCSINYIACCYEKFHKNEITNINLLEKTIYKKLTFKQFFY